MDSPDPRGRPPSASVLEPPKPQIVRGAASAPWSPAVAREPAEEPLAALAALRSELSRSIGDMATKAPALALLLARFEELLASRARCGAEAKAAEAELAPTLDLIEAVMEGALLGYRSVAKTEAEAKPGTGGEVPA